MESRVEPVHPVRVAILPLIDDRQAGDGQDTKEFTYDGIRYRATELKDLRGDGLDQITELLAKHLARARVFAQVILVLEPSQAPEADLLLFGHVYRLRGYVEKVKEEEQTDVSVLSEVVLTDMVLEDAKNRGRVLFAADVGWTTLERRPRTEEGPTPWDVLAETLQVAVESFAQEVGQADLTGRYDVREAVALELVPTASTATAAFGRLAEAPPHGWGFRAQEKPSRPIGWKGEAGCEQVSYVQRQTLRFHRALGPYRPTVHLWACPVSVGFKYDGQEEFPALYLGSRFGRRYFGHTLGETNWANALEQITAHLRIEPPVGRYHFDLPGR